MATGYDSLLSSPDGANWTRHTNVTGASEFTGAVFGHSTFVVVGSSGSIAQFAPILTSPDAATWTHRNSTATCCLDDIAYGAGVFVAVGSDESGRFPNPIETSTDGVKWTQRSSGAPGHLFGVAYGNGTFVAVGESGRILQSGFVALPKLEIELVDDTLLISWPASVSDAVLEMTDSVVTAKWVPVPNCPVVVGNENVVTLDATGAAKFFRFSRPGN
ncbi:MAG: hypothetical protein DME26_10210 [Verrucomicrobia bacterium]|nr:MAG: hypothetical protein DME26_10210 [Verrucomicrobiota bacterium]